MFAPVICWNWAHDWVSFRMQSTARFEAADGIELGCGLQSMVEQWVFVLPLTLPLAAVVVRRLARLAQPRDQFLFWSFAPMAFFFFLIGWTPSWHLLWSLLCLPDGDDGHGRSSRQLARCRVAFLPRPKWPYMVVPQSCGVVVILLHSVFVLPGVPPLRETYGWD